jgi:two-component system OmpR family sensor kinase
VAERDHEARNVVAGLAGAANLIDFPRPNDEAEVLRAAMTAELARLEALLGGSTAAGPTQYRVLPVLRKLIALRRSNGMDIELAAELGLGAVGSPTTLAQALTNVLANCAAHAPGSPVLITAKRDRDNVKILVSDLGPGIAIERGRDVFESGVRGASSGGQGLGLHISRQLLEADGGTVSIRPRSADQPGCTVELVLPAVPVTDSAELHLVRSA